jgi:hypothetical protein
VNNLTRFAQYALARSTSASEGRAASLRHCVAWNCLRWSTELAYSRRVGAAKDVKSRIEVVGEEIYSTKDRAMANSNALKKWNIRDVQDRQFAMRRLTWWSCGAPRKVLLRCMTLSWRSRESALGRRRVELRNGQAFAAPTTPPTTTMEPPHPDERPAKKRRFERYLVGCRRPTVDARPKHHAVAIHQPYSHACLTHCED